MPTRQQRQDNTGPATQAFLKWIEGRHAVSHSAHLDDFVPSRAVSEYLGRDNRLETILTETFPSSEVRPSGTIILEKHCQLFAILLAIGSVEFIREFIPYPALKDERLPFTDRPTSFPHDTRTSGFGSRRAKDDLFARFRKRQPYFCAPKIEKQHGYYFDSDSILPYTEKVEIGRGASSVVHKVAIHSRHDGLRAGHGMPHVEPDHQHYALKVYQGPDSERCCHDEVKAFKALGRTGLEATGIIGHYGSYVYREQHHLLLEHADLGDLERIVARERPPSVDGEIVAFWENIFAIVSAVVKIHDIQDGVHQDIKMSNVLVKRRRNSRNLYEAAFGLADLGTMRHRDHTTGERTMDNHGVKAYGKLSQSALRAPVRTSVTIAGLAWSTCQTSTASAGVDDNTCAPECHRDDTFDDSRRFAITAAADIFSVGCLLSELSAWVVFGFQGEHGLQGYREERIVGHGDEVRGQDSFHCRGENGRELLPAVTAAHDKLLGASRCDSTTKAIVEMLPELLAIERELRPTAKSLRHRLNLLVKKSKAKLSEAQPRTPIQTPPNKSPVSSVISAPTSPSPDRRPTRNLANRRVAITTAYSEVDSDRHGFHTGHEDLGAMVDSPRTMTLQDAHAHFRSDDIGDVLAAASANLDLEHQHVHSPENYRQPRRRTNDTDREPMPMSYEPSNSQRSALDSMRRETLPVMSAPYARPANRSSTTAPSSIPFSASGSMDNTQNELSPPTADLIHGIHTSVRPPRQTIEPIRRGSEHSRSFRRSNNDIASRGLAPSQNRHIQIPHESTDTTLLTAAPAPVPDHPTPMSYDPGPSSPATIPIERATTHSRAPRKPPAVLTYSAAAEYMDRTKHNEKCMRLPGHDFMLQLEKRDHVFVMDNSKSMYEIYEEDNKLGRKPNHRALVRLLGWLIKSMDPDGLDLHYFSAAKKYKTEPLTNCDTSTRLETSLIEAECTHTTTPNLEVGNLLAAYRQRLADYRESLRSRLGRLTAKVTGPPRPLSLYILTDGVWESPDHEGGDYLETEISELVKALVAAGYPRKQVGIQFIRFGNHEFGKQRLDHLDRLNKKLELGRDIVDTEPVEGGNIWKMLLGAINERFDDDGDDYGEPSSQKPSASTTPASGN
ncbi:hypothetical protein LTR95_009923 [Oleoguttula sp. CCFEE 5521]